MPIERLTRSIEGRTWEVQMPLAGRGRDRAPTNLGNLIAATAERTGSTVSAADEDFDQIAYLADQLVEPLELC